MRSVLFETYDFARRNSFGFNLTYIDKDLPSPGSFGFEASYMRSLYQYGYHKAKTGDFWRKRHIGRSLAKWHSLSKIGYVAMKAQASITTVKRRALTILHAFEEATRSLS